MAKYCMAPAGAAWQRCYRNCGRPAGTLWQSTAWPLQGLRGKGTMETVVALQRLFGKGFLATCMAPAGAAWQRSYRNCGRPAGTIWQSIAWPLQGLRGKGTIETVVALQVLYGKVLHGPCRGCKQRYYRNCDCPAGTIWQSTTWPLQGLRGKGTIETVVALQVLYGKVLHGPCRGCVAKVPYKL